MFALCRLLVSKLFYANFHLPVLKYDAVDVTFAIYSVEMRGGNSIFLAANDVHKKSSTTRKQNDKLEEDFKVFAVRNVPFGPLRIIW